MVHKSNGESEFAFDSSLSAGIDRFLARALAHALEHDFRDADDFLQHFPPLDLMRALDAAPELRGELLTKTVGFHERIARKKSAESAADDLHIALEEGVTNPANILESISLDDRVRYLDHARLFTFAVDPEFFSLPFSERERELAAERLAFLLEAALDEELISLSDVIDAVGIETIASSLDLQSLRKIVETALSQGRAGAPLTFDRLLDIVPLSDLVRSLSLESVLRTVILRRVAEPFGFVTDKDRSALAAPVERPAPERRVERNGVEAAPARSAAPRRNGERKNGAPPATKATKPPAAAPAKPPAEPAASGPRSETDLSADLEGDAEDLARQRVTERLSNIKRLPPRHRELSVQILFEIDSMYADFFAASTDAAREEAIRDSFPNEQHMATALLALIELLEPSIDVSDPEIAKADVDSLMNVFLIEERDQRERATSQRPGGSVSISGIVPPPPPPVKRSAPPPPLQRAAGQLSPPPLPGSAEKIR